MTIETRGLRKAFGDHVVLDGIDLAVAEYSDPRKLDRLIC